MELFLKTLIRTCSRVGELLSKDLNKDLFLGVWSSFQKELHTPRNRSSLRSFETSFTPLEQVLIKVRYNSLEVAEGQSTWDNYKGSPMLELWTARTRSREEPQMQH